MLGDGGTPLSKLLEAIREFQARTDRRVDPKGLRAGIDFNLASIPADFSITGDEPFDRNYMVALFERGFQLGNGHYPWIKTPPGLELTVQARN